MSTRCAIGYTDKETGKLHTIYCHYDGYPSHVGKILKQYHNSAEACRALLVGSHIRNFDNDGTVCRFGEGDGAAETFDSVAETLNSGYDYVYTFAEFDQNWHCYGRNYDTSPSAIVEKEIK